ncbi:mannosyl-glycoprotein endo-beta-N-acetylglucosamidase [Pandoraea sp. NPDC090278]|uniref:mannosyl-glycoprotein endo-beta-N-acetylglucosamidase n=1 Tax=Pandoraea sp. NPDC090278 TaxID=3364391 RepID=UPI00383ADA38
MADEPTVIRDFLVTLGYKVDERSLKTFKDGVEGATKGAVQMVETIENAAVKLGVNLAAFASKMEGVYFASQRSGATVANLKALEFSAKNLGVSSETARNSVEALARFMRSNPAGESYIKRLGVQTRDANGQLLDTVDIMASLGGALASKPAKVAGEYGSALGIDEGLMAAMRGGEFGKSIEQYRNLTAQTDFDGASRDSHRFMLSLRELEAVWDGFVTRLEGSLIQRLGPKLDEFQGWFQRNGPLIEQRVGDVAMAVIGAGEAIAPVVGGLFDLFVDLDKSTDGWSTKILGGVFVLRALGAFQLVGGVFKMAEALFAVGRAAATVSGISGAASAAAAAAGGAAAGGGVVGGRIAGLLSRAAPFARIGGALALLFHSEGLNQGEAEDLARRRKLGMTVSNPDGTTSNVLPPGVLPRGPHNITSGNTRFGRGEVAKVADDFADFVMSDDSLRAKGDLLRGQARRGLSAVRGAINRAPLAGNDAGAYVGAMVKRFGVGDDQALNMRDPNVMAGLTAEITRQENGRNPFAPDTFLGAAASGGPRQTIITQNNQTSINVSGGDPQATGRAVRDEQAGVNRELTRNLQGALL